MPSVSSMLKFALVVVVVGAVFVVVVAVVVLCGWALKFKRKGQLCRPDAACLIPDAQPMPLTGQTTNVGYRWPILDLWPKIRLYREWESSENFP